MGARRREVDLGTHRLSDIEDVEIRLTEGIEVKLEEVEVNAGGLLAFQGHQVVLYIPDQGRYIEKVLQDASDGKKVHVTDCTALKRMRQAGRFERYAVRNGLSPAFKVHGVAADGRVIEGVEAELLVCRYCLTKLNYKGYQISSSEQRTRIVRDFSLEEFFSRYSSYFSRLPRDAAEKLRANVYSPDWAERSNQVREQAGWQCKKCRVNLKEHKNLLHVHHRNGNRQDNCRDNLIALCVDCHSKQAQHEFMFVRHSDRQIIQRLRREQAIYIPPRAGSRSEQDWDNAFQDADPAVHDLLTLIRHCEEPVPEIGFDIADASGEIVCSNVELGWPARKQAVVLARDDSHYGPTEFGWNIMTVGEAVERYTQK